MDIGTARAGNFLIVSFPEPVPGDETLYFIQDNQIGGIILFADHCQDQDSLRSWLAELQKSLGRRLIIAVDQEGGRVQRFTRRFPMLEAPRYYGEADRIDRYRSDLARVCERLREVGVNLNLVPTVDLFDAGDGHVLDGRTFSDNPAVVERLARETIAIHHRHGLLTCGKHFPGLGRATGDPHAVLSAADLTEKDFFEIEIPPFQAVIRDNVDAVMVTHLSAPRVDTKPSIISETVITGWLKEKLGFRGAVITDDLLMAGAAEADPTPYLAGKSFAAGADLLLFGRELSRTRQLYDAFCEMWHRGDFPPHRIDDACERLHRFIGGLAT
jgi:beta-N-acetylhexosaminidase